MSAFVYYGSSFLSLYSFNRNLLKIKRGLDSLYYYFLFLFIYGEEYLEWILF